ncbi:N-acyl homoserine lactonase family protein [Amycolatopsis sp. Poz14]|uniref:N-acyl homoserine lactonase family protein n=1 Tax=Amycolatopsis sp. Poz14 TaxID=1447705 RepID=UPI001EE7928C|nr:N-acyl homoserine lactonase family protein [Amycolatopsis sp. Poz14]MCG3754002.1 N-acyl homoserine lactonase family protein [Amycolatopsis sp. Poz14]
MSTAKRLWPLAGASFTLDRGLIVLGQSGPIALPIPAFLIEHDDGLVLLDTGIAPEAWDDPKGTYGPLLDMFALDCPPENTLEQQIANCGFRLEDVTHVVVSHSHFDHTGGLYLFPQAKMYMSEEDLRYAFWPDPAYSLFFRSEDLDRTRSFDWHPLSADHDLFGDGSIQILRMPGHTHGELSMLVSLPSQKFLLTADAVHLRCNMDQYLPCPVDLDATTALRSVRRIKELAHSTGADIWVMHDPEDWERLGKNTDGFA